MTSHTTDRFRRLFAELPFEVKDLARKNYLLWKNDPNHPSLDFKKVHYGEDVFSIRVGNDWRALGQRDHDTIIWYWIGSHSEYDKILSRRR